MTKKKNIHEGRLHGDYGGKRGGNSRSPPILPSFSPSFFPEYDLTRSPPSKFRSLLSELLESCCMVNIVNREVKHHVYV